jgi:two-component system, OmpR family, response regulator Irr
MPRKILLVEDHLGIRKNIAFFLRTEGYEVNEASDGNEAIQLLERHEVDLVPSNVVMPGFGGFHLLRHIRSVAPEVPVVIMSGVYLNAQRIRKEGQRISL